MIINCDYCKKEFERPLKHVNRNKKLGRKNYCLKECRYKAHSKRMFGEDNPSHKSETKEKISNTLKIRFQNKENHPFFGKGLKPEHKKKISETIRKLGLSSGKNNPNWKGGITPKNIKERNAPENKQFTQEILKRDNYICKICSQHGGKLAVDHIMAWSLYPELRQYPDNVRTLCEPCHKGYGARPHRNKWAISPVNHLHLRYV